MGAKVSRTDFEWVLTEEPHASRREMILSMYFSLLCYILCTRFGKIWFKNTYQYILVILNIIIDIYTLIFITVVAKLVHLFIFTFSLLFHLKYE